METAPWRSPRPRVLLVLRGVFGLLTLGICIVGLVAIPAIYFAYLTHWGVCSVLLFYSLSLATLRWKALVKAVKPLFTIAWCLEWVIVPIYWTWVYTQESSVPWAYTIVVHALLLVEAAGVPLSSARRIHSCECTGHCGRGRAVPQSQL